MHIDESTFLQLIEAVAAQRDVIESLQARTGHPLSYVEMHVVRHSKDLEGVARTQARLSGIVPPSPPGARS